MAILPANLSRVSNALRTSVVSSAITRTQAQMLAVQNEMASGKKLATPSADPGDAAVAMQLRKTLEQRESFTTNLKAAGNQLGEVDSTLQAINELIEQAKTIASANVGSDVTPDARNAAAAVVENLYNQALSLANKQHEGVYLFAGDRSTDAPFESQGGGVTFVGSSRLLANQVDEKYLSTFMVDGAALFGAVSSQVQGAVDLTPTMTADTRLSDLRGRSGNGVAVGSIVINTGSMQATVDLSAAQSVGDVINAINAAEIGGVTASLAGNGHSIQITPGGSETLSITNAPGGTTAYDLGILQTSPLGAGIAKTGSNLSANVTNLTPLSALRDGAGINTSGLQISNGSRSATIDLTGATTVEDLLNRVNASDTGVRAEINSAGTGINLINATQGAAMTIAENGGTTATDLGIRSYGPATVLSTLNNGQGVRTVAGDDFRITRSDGTSFTVDLSAAVTVQDVITAINTADGGAGVTASFSTTGNRLLLTDTAGGPGSIALSSQNFSNAAADLGLLAAPSGNVIASDDRNPIRAAGLFANLASLRDGLRASDQSKITAAGEGLNVDQQRVITTRGTVGAQVQEIESRQTRIEDQNVATKALLSQLEDTDYTDAIARFQTLQTMLEASLRTGVAQMNLSLLDFLG